MVGAEVLDATRFVQYSISLDGGPTARAGDHWLVRGDLDLHGQSPPDRRQSGPPGVDIAKGSTTLRQTEFGITPISIGEGRSR